MENISNFLAAAKRFGVMEISCFQTVDLYENKQCYKVGSVTRENHGFSLEIWDFTYVIGKLKKR